MPTGLAPNTDRARALAETVNRRLLDSLDYVLGEAGDALQIGGQQHQDWIARLRGQQAAPRTHALFHRLVSEIESDDLAGAGQTVAFFISF